MIVTKGKAIFQLNNIEVVVEVGEGIFIKPNVLHGAQSILGAECSFFAVVFHPAFLSYSSSDCVNQNYINPILNHSITIPVHLKRGIQWQKEALELLEQVFLIGKERELGYELLLKSKIFEIWYKCIQNSSKLDVNVTYTNYKADRMKVILQFISENYPKKIMISDLSSILHMSKEHFCRFFKEMTHYTPVSYINLYRVQKSCMLLLETDKKISEIAGGVGFDGASYYNKIFRNIMGCTPVEYRSSVKKVKNKENCYQPNISLQKPVFCQRRQVDWLS